MLSKDANSRTECLNLHRKQELGKPGDSSNNVCDKLVINFLTYTHPTGKKKVSLFHELV